MRGVINNMFVIAGLVFLAGCMATTKTATTTTPQGPVIYAPAPEATEETAAPAIEKKEEVLQAATAEGIEAAEGRLAAKITYDRVTNLITEFVDIKEAGTDSGQTRYVGTSENKLITVELIGDKEDLALASIRLSYPDGIDAVNRDLNNAMMLRFLKNMVPVDSDVATIVTNITGTFYSLMPDQIKKEDINIAGLLLSVLYDRNNNSITLIYKAR